MASKSAIASDRMQNPDRNGDEDRPNRDLREDGDVEGADERDGADDANTATTEREDLRRGEAAVARAFNRAVGRRLIPDPPGGCLAVLGVCGMTSTSRQLFAQLTVRRRRVDGGRTAPPPAARSSPACSRWV